MQMGICVDGDAAFVVLSFITAVGPARWLRANGNRHECFTIEHPHRSGTRLFRLSPSSVPFRPAGRVGHAAGVQVCYVVQAGSD